MNSNSINGQDSDDVHGQSETFMNANYSTSFDVQLEFPPAPDRRSSPMPDTSTVEPLMADPSSSDTDRYLVSRDAEESARLDMQHKLVVGAMGYRIHPHIVRHIFGGGVQLDVGLEAAKEHDERIEPLARPFEEHWKTQSSCSPTAAVQSLATAPPTRTIRIADIATGTGVWLFDLKRQLAGLASTVQAELHGFDISDAQLPKGYNTPDGSDTNTFPIRFHVHNAKQPYPAALHSTFDIVHIRYVLMGMESAEDWATVAQNAIALLKPGGALQWTEPNVYAAIRWCRSSIPATIFEDRADADEDDLDVGVSFFNRHFRTWAALFRHRLESGWDTLPQTYRRLGLVQIIEDIVRSDRVAECRHMTVMNTIDAWNHVLAAIAASGQGYMSEEELAHIIAKMRKYADMGTYSTFDIHTLVGYKPR